MPVQCVVEAKYSCVACGEGFVGTSEYNPWWNLATQVCPNCQRETIPRIDILDPENACNKIQSARERAAGRRPGAAGEGAGGGRGWGWGGGGGPGGGGWAKGCGCVASKEEHVAPMAMGSLEAKGALCRRVLGEGLGPALDLATEDGELKAETCSRLLVLMRHARLCPGEHREPRLLQVCQSVKFMMLHLRDCDDAENCPFSWCKPCTQLLRHLYSCREGEYCEICSPCDLPRSLLELQAMNTLTEERRFEESAPKDEDEDEDDEFWAQDLAAMSPKDEEDDGLYVGARGVEDAAEVGGMADDLGDYFMKAT